MEAVCLIDTGMCLLPGFLDPIFPSSSRHAGSAQVWHPGKNQFSTGSILHFGPWCAPLGPERARWRGSDGYWVLPSSVCQYDIQGTAREDSRHGKFEWRRWCVDGHGLWKFTIIKHNVFNFATYSFNRTITEILLCNLIT